MTTDDVQISLIGDVDEKMRRACRDVIAQHLPEYADKFYRRIQSSSPHRVMFIAANPRMIVGVLMGFVYGMGAQKKSDIDTFFIDKRCQRQGLGKKMLAQYEDYVRSQRSVRQINVNATLRSVNFYKQYGYSAPGGFALTKKFERQK